jgi:hypothetical protein
VAHVLNLKWRIPRTLTKALKSRKSSRETKPIGGPKQSRLDRLIKKHAITEGQACLVLALEAARRRIKGWQRADAQRLKTSEVTLAGGTVRSSRKDATTSP